MRGSRGPRQPGGGKQIAGSRQQRRFVRRHPEAAAKGLPKQPSKDGGLGRAASAGRLHRPLNDGGKRSVAPAILPTAVQNVAVTADEGGMRVDRFLEARFPGLSFSHIQRVIRKGEVRVNG